MLYMLGTDTCIFLMRGEHPTLAESALQNSFEPSK